MKTIWKFTIELTSEQKVLMPRGAEILTVQIQRDFLSLWARVDPKAEAEERSILVRGTGHEVQDHAKYIGTVQVLDGQFIWHVFEGKE